MDIVILILLAVLTVLISAVLIIILFSRNKSDDAAVKTALIEEHISLLEKRMSAEFSVNRRESAEQQKEMREKTERQLSDMNDKINSFMLKNSEQQNMINETVNKGLFKIQQGNEKKLDQMRETVDEKLSKTLSARLDSSFKTVSAQLENVYKSLGEVKTLSSGVTNNITALNRVLTNVKARGTWAEIQLGNILDQTIPSMYETNIETVPGSGERVEFAVKVPNEDNSIIYLPLDSKFPMEDYVRLMDALDSGEKQAADICRKALEKSVEEQAKRVTKYISVPSTTPFAILYLATEGLYAEIASSRSGIMEKMQNKYKIMIAGPSTVTALLNSMAMGFRTIAINKKADDIAKALAAAKTQYGKFEDLLDAAFKKVGEAGRKIEEARRRNTLISRKLKKFEDIETTEAAGLLGFDESE